MKSWLKWTLTIVIFVGLTLALYFIGFKGEWLKPIIEQAGVWGYIIYLLAQIIITTVMCFVPATTFTFTLMSVQLFGLIPGFILSAIGCWISSIIMFIVGKYGGVKLVDWLVGKESREKTQKLVKDKAVIYIPIMLAFPFFPDDALCMIAGMTKMKLWYFAIISLFTRSIGIAGTAFLGDGAVWQYILNTLGDNIVLWFMFINLILFDIYAIWKFTRWLEAWIKKRREKKEKQVSENVEGTTKKLESEELGVIEKPKTKKKSKIKETKEIKS